MMIFSARAWFFLGFLFCVFLLGTALYLQNTQNLDPCPLCISQRIAVLLIGVIFLIAAIHNPEQTGLRIYALTGFLASSAGAAIAARHVWLQHLPPEQVPECGPGLDYMFQHFPFTQTLKFMLSGTGDCAKIDWTLFGLSMPNWTLMCFIFLALLSLVQCWNVKKTSRTVLYRI